jgi:hypothetical protein
MRYAIILAEEHPEHLAGTFLAQEKMWPGTKIAT